MAKHAAPSPTVEIDASHAVLLSHPDALVELIHKAVAGSSHGERDGQETLVPVKLYRTADRVVTAAAMAGLRPG